MQKRHIAIVLLTGLLCAALLVSCRQSPGTETQGISTGTDIDYLSDPKFDTEEALPQYDCDKSWVHRLGGNTACATEDTLYSIGTIGNYDYIFFCDLTTGISGPLCGKPECTHNDGRCNAYTRGAAYGLSIYDGQLFWMDYDENWDPAIFCMSLDGLNRVKVCKLDRSRKEKIHGDRTLVFHRGYAIYGGRATVVADGSPQYGLLVYAVSLATGEETVILEQMFEDGIAPTVDTVPWRDKLYLVTHQWMEDGQEDKVNFCIFEWKLKTHETSLLYTQTGDFVSRSVWPTENGLLLSEYDSGEIYRFHFPGDELELLFDLNSGGGDHYGAEFADNYLIDWTLSEERMPRLWVTDLEGSVVYDEELDLPDWPTQGFGYVLIGADDKNVYAQLWSQKKESPMKAWQITTIVQIPLDGGGSVRELWSVERELG